MTLFTCNQHQHLNSSQTNLLCHKYNFAIKLNLAVLFSGLSLSKTKKKSQSLLQFLFLFKLSTHLHTSLGGEKYYNKMSTKQLTQGSGSNVEPNNWQTLEAGIQYFRSMLHLIREEIYKIETNLTGTVCSIKAEAKACQTLSYLKQLSERARNQYYDPYMVDKEKEMYRTLLDAEISFRSLCWEAKYTDLMYFIRRLPPLSQASGSESVPCSSLPRFYQTTSTKANRSREEALGASGMLTTSNKVAQKERVAPYHETPYSRMSFSKNNRSLSIEGSTKQGLESQNAELDFVSPQSMSDNLGNLHSIPQMMRSVQSSAMISPGFVSSPTAALTPGLSMENRDSRDINTFQASKTISLTAKATHCSKANDVQTTRSQNFTRECSNCCTNTSRQWLRKFKAEDEWLCHACGQYWRKNKRDRPSEFWQKPVVKRTSRYAVSGRKKREKGKVNKVAPLTLRVQKTTKAVCKNRTYRCLSNTKTVQQSTNSMKVSSCRQPLGRPIQKVWPKGRRLPSLHKLIPRAEDDHS